MTNYPQMAVSVLGEEVSACDPHLGWPLDRSRVSEHVRAEARLETPRNQVRLFTTLNTDQDRIGCPFHCPNNQHRKVSVLGVALLLGSQSADRSVMYSKRPGNVC